MLLKITLGGETSVIEEEPLETLEKYEKHLELWLSKNLDRLMDGIRLWTIHREKQGKSEPDVVALDDRGNTFIFELKRGKADYEAVGQLFNYWSTIAKMDYDNLLKMGARYHNRSDFNLSIEHSKYFGLKKPLEKEKFNKESRLIAVSEEADASLLNIITFLRENYRVPLSFVRYKTYRMKEGSNDELIIHFDNADTDKLLNQITGEDAIVDSEVYDDNAERFFWYNTDKDHLDYPSEHDKIFKIGVAATYGPASYGEKLASAKKGDKVFAYANGEGIRAYGTVAEKWNGKSIPETGEAAIRNFPQYHLPVDWERVLDKEKAIRPDEIRARGYNNFRGTFRRIYNPEFVNELKKEINSRV